MSTANKPAVILASTPTGKRTPLPYDGLATGAKMLKIANRIARAAKKDTTLSDASATCMTAYRAIMRHALRE